ncbi:MAG: 50S ribosomal protein L1 [Armatimonadetes bacterium]|nr:50S ribosomal protein L1 [Armatimonadota bacterium]
MRQNIRSKTKSSVRFAAIAKTVNKDQVFGIEEAIALAKANATAKFVESIDISVKLGIDTRKGEQNVRGITNLPHGTGKVKVVWVLAKGDDAKEAEAAGADYVGAEELIAKIIAGEKKFDVIVASDEMAPQIGKIGKALGPKTPNKRNGTVTNNVAQAVADIKGATRVEYRADKGGVVHLPIGKANFPDEHLLENFKAGLTAIIRAKPSGAKGKYLQSITITSSMGVGLLVDSTVAQKFTGVN